MTGTSAFGYRCLMTDHAPWSRPHLSSSPTSVFFTNALVSRASVGLPGAGYCTSNSALGNPPKSWMVGGLGMAVTNVPRVSQCADTHRIARGLGNPAATDRKPCTNSFSSIAFIGLPCPRNSTGIFSVGANVSASAPNSPSFIAAAVIGRIASRLRNSERSMELTLLIL